jgi:hypothetical protein
MTTPIEADRHTEQTGQGASGSGRAGGVRVLVTGSRTWTDRDTVWAALDGVAQSRPASMTVVHGACPRGADLYAAQWVTHHLELGHPVVEEAHPADWDRDGRAAGPRRNQRMVAGGADLCLTFIGPCLAADCFRPLQHGTHRAVHCATAARDAGIPIHHA